MLKIFFFTACWVNVVFSGVPLYYFKKTEKKDNFGDRLSLVIVEGMLKRHVEFTNDQSYKGKKLLAIGSILHNANDETVVWGSGRNGKIQDHAHKFKKLDVRAVRGPLTREFLLSRGIACPEVYGDPALLLPLLLPKVVAKAKANKKYDYIVIPNINEIRLVKNKPNVVLPTSPYMKIIERIVSSKLVISSSLHGIIVAEAFKIPAILLRISDKENMFKYTDYYYATNRKNFKVAHSIEEALELGGEVLPEIDLQPLIDSFPYDIFD